MPTVSLVKTYDVANVTRASLRQLGIEIFASVTYRFTNCNDGSVDRHGYLETEDSVTPGNLVIRVYEYDASEAPNSAHVTNMIQTAMTAGEITSMDGVVSAHVVVTTLSKVHCRATLDATQVISNLTTTDILFPTEDYDIGGMHSTSANTDEIKIPPGGDGLYTIDAGFEFEANSTGVRFGIITINNVLENPADQIRLEATSSGTFNAHFGRQAKLVAGDIVRLQVRQNSGDDLNCDAAHIEVAKVG